MQSIEFRVLWVLVTVTALVSAGASHSSYVLNIAFMATLTDGRHSIVGVKNETGSYDVRRDFSTGVYGYPEVQINDRRDIVHVHKTTTYPVRSFVEYWNMDTKSATMVAKGNVPGAYGGYNTINRCASINSSSSNDFSVSAFSALRLNSLNQNVTYLCEAFVSGAPQELAIATSFVALRPNPAEPEPRRYARLRRLISL